MRPEPTVGALAAGIVALVIAAALALPLRLWRVRTTSRLAPP
jgi:hypothetical protein